MTCTLPIEFTIINDYWLIIEGVNEHLLSGSVIKGTNILVALKWIFVFFNKVTEGKLFTTI